MVYGKLAATLFVILIAWGQIEMVLAIRKLNSLKFSLFMGILWVACDLVFLAIGTGGI